MPPTPLARPTASQLAWQEMELEMFIHFGPNTWQTNEGWDDLSTPASAINPAELDTDQWARVAKSFGAGQIVMVAKHVGGFALWQTETTTFGIKETPWRGGKGDVMADLAESCRKHGLKLGVYLSPMDRTFNAGMGAQCANGQDQARYDPIYREQLTELLTRYGEISEVWFDGSLVVEVGDILKKCAPDAVVFQGAYTTIRWVGNEWGYAPYPAWNSCPSLGSGARDGRPDGADWLPLEVDTTLHNPTEWFWRQKTAGQIRSVEELMDIYYKSVGRGAVLLLNAAPDTTGRIPDCDEKRFAEFGAEIQRRFGRAIATTTGSGETVELKLGGMTAIDHVITMEEIAEGERVHEYHIEGLGSGGWKTLCRGISIGHKKIDPITPVEVSAVRLCVTKSGAPPLIKSLSVYKTGVAPPRSLASVAGPGKAVKIGEWDPNALKDGSVTQEYDLTPFCKEARSYQITFADSPTHDQVNTYRSVLLVNGTETKGFIGSTNEFNVFYVNLTGVAEKMVLRVSTNIIAFGGLAEPRKGDVLMVAC